MQGRKWTVQRAIIYLLAAVLPPIMVGVLIALLTVSRIMVHQEPLPVDEPIHFQPPEKTPGQKTALILISNSGTQATEVFLSAKTLSETGRYNVFLVAPEKRLSPTTAAISLFPHMSLKEAPEADLLIVPSLLPADEEVTLEWLKERIPTTPRIVSLGEGAISLALTGALNGKTIATHFIAANEFSERFPQVSFSSEYRWIRDGKLISSPGLASTPETLMLLEEDEPSGIQFGPKLNTEELALSTSDYLQLFAEAAYGWSTSVLGVELYPGMDERLLSAVLEVFPRSFAFRAFTYNQNRSPMLSQNGLILVPTFSHSAIERPDIWMTAPDGEEMAAPSSETTEATDSTSDSNFFDSPDERERPFRASLEYLSTKVDPGLAGIVSRIMLIPEEELPASKDELKPTLRFWFAAALKVLLLSTLGIALAAFFDYRLSSRLRASPR